VVLFIHLFHGLERGACAERWQGEGIAVEPDIAVDGFFEGFAVLEVVGAQDVGDAAAPALDPAVRPCRSFAAGEGGSGASRCKQLT